jgi:hypothetical protein
MHGLDLQWLLCLAELIQYFVIENILAFVKQPMHFLIGVVLYYHFSNKTDIGHAGLVVNALGSNSEVQV